EPLVGFDFGSARIGAAVGNTLTASARPLAQIDNRVSARGFEAIARLLAEWQPQRLIVGRPLHPDGTPHEMTARCERFARQLHGRVGLPVNLVDERYSTVEAEAGGEGGRNIDAQAAAIILRQYLQNR
ncbi:MAG: Holliday junction resolvase RuvX, partial [Betaproteobacteria bacterium]